MFARGEKKKKKNFRHVALCNTSLAHKKVDPVKKGRGFVRDHACRPPGGNVFLGKKGQKLPGIPRPLQKGKEKKRMVGRPGGEKKSGSFRRDTKREKLCTPSTGLEKKDGGMWVNKRRTQFRFARR